MLKLNLSLRAWSSDVFHDIFIREVGTLDADTLLLQQGLRYSSYANSDNLTVTLLNTRSDDSKLYIRAGLFYTGIIAGCNCADDPSPVDENNEYCEVLFCVNRRTAETTVSLID